MTEHELSGQAEGRVTVSAQVAVVHTGGWTWQSHWLLLTKYLARLHEIYNGARVDSNTDLWAIVNSFMVDCYHLSEAFSHDLGLGTDVRAALQASPELALCRDYANTWKHFRRDKNARVAMIWEDGDSPSGGRFVTIAHRLRDDPIASQQTIDSLDLARGAWEAWRAFMRVHGITEPVELTRVYLDVLDGSKS